MGERLDLPVGLSAGDHQEIVEARELADIEDLDVAGLDVFEGGNGNLRAFVEAHP